METTQHSGILVVDKPAGITSHRVLERLKRLARKTKMGHGGTLDPFATGVLPVFVGRATRLAQFFLQGDKEYEGRIRFGWATDTHDLDGAPLGEARPCDIGPVELEAWAEDHRGRIRQRPPAFSAVKWQGESLHVHARRGRPVEAPEREVVISRLEILDWTPPELRIRVDCSAGTYIRVIAHELGMRAGCGAHLTALRRFRSGPFTLQQAIPLEELEDNPALLGERLLPMESLLPEYPACRCGPDQLARVRNGNELGVPPVAGPDSEYVRVLDPEGRLLAIGRVVCRTETGLVIHPHVVLA
jgi:tRNA pseudouridine55 synthase